MRPLSQRVLWSISALAGAAFIVVSRQVSRRQTAGGDRQVREGLQERRRSVGDDVAHATNPLGKEWFHLPAAAALGLYIARRSRTRGSARGALTPVIASIAAEVLSRVADRLPPYRRPPAGHPKPHKPSFPSGHALETTAVAGIGAYVLAREHLASAPAAFGTAAGLSLASTLGRLYLDRHWASDAVAGTALGLSVAAACAALYEAGAPRVEDRAIAHADRG
jgi:membrane-associated phospholipid phosphatase